MKRIFTIVSLVVLMVACDFGPRQAGADNNRFSVSTGGSFSYSVAGEKLDGIEYHIYKFGESLFVINHTKELLEVEKLRKELGHE